MMKPHIELRPKNLLRLKMKPTLLYASVGLSIAIVVCFGLFMFQLVGNSESAKAGLNKKFKFKLFQQTQKEGVEAAVEVEMFSTADSLYIDYMSVDKNEIRSAVLNIRDFGTNAEKNAQQVRTYTLQSAKKISENHFQFAVSLKQIPCRVIVETGASVRAISKNQTEGTKELNAVINRVSFNPKDYSFIPTPAGLKSNNVSVKAATVSWNAIDEAIKYKIRSRAVGSESWNYGTVMAPGNQRPFVNLEPATEYEYQVQAIIKNEKMDSTGYSSLATFWTEPLPKL